MEVSNETKTAADMVQVEKPTKQYHWQQNPALCTFCKNEHAHNSNLCAPCRAFIDMRNACLGLFTPKTLREFINTMHNHKIASTGQLLKLAEDRNAYQLATLAKRLRTCERDTNRNMFPRLLEGIESVAAHTEKKAQSI